MDVERIQKVNNLAMELMKQGLASTRDDALEQAEKIYRNQETDGYKEMVDTLEGINDDNSTASQTAEANVAHLDTDSSENTPKTALSEDKIEEILKKNTQFLVKTIKGFQEEITKLKDEMRSIKSRASMYQTPRPREVVVEPVSGTQATSVQEAVAATTPGQGQPKEAPVKDHPRSGNYNDTDVSIEKFFYMGHK